MATRTDGAVLARAGLLSDAGTEKKYELGTTIIDENGNVYEYVATAQNVTVAVGSVLALLPAGAALFVTGGTGQAAVPIGVSMGACTAIASTVQYLWVCVKTGANQTIPTLFNGAVAQYAGLQSTATGGAIDDVTGGIDIKNMNVYTAVGAGGLAGAVLNFPFTDGATFQ